jgi:uncharacterized membrane protein
MSMERVIGVVLRAGVVLSSTCLTVGLVTYLVVGGADLSRLLLQIGVIVLLATPVARVVVSIGQYISERDWAFAALTAMVLLELMASAVAALVFNRRL